MERSLAQKDGEPLRTPAPPSVPLTATAASLTQNPYEMICSPLLERRTDSLDWRGPLQDLPGIKDDWIEAALAFLAGPEHADNRKDLCAPHSDAALGLSELPSGTFPAVRAAGESHSTTQHECAPQERVPVSSATALMHRGPSPRQHPALPAPHAKLVSTSSCSSSSAGFLAATAPAPASAPDPLTVSRAPGQRPGTQEDEDIKALGLVPSVRKARFWPARFGLEPEDLHCLDGELHSQPGSLAARPQQANARPDLASSQTPSATGVPQPGSAARQPGIADPKPGPSSPPRRNPAPQPRRPGLLESLRQAVERQGVKQPPIPSPRIASAAAPHQAAIPGEELHQSEAEGTSRENQVSLSCSAAPETLVPPLQKTMACREFASLGLVLWQQGLFYQVPLVLQPQEPPDPRPGQGLAIQGPRSRTVKDKGRACAVAEGGPAGRSVGEAGGVRGGRGVPSSELGRGKREGSGEGTLDIQDLAELWPQSLPTISLNSKLAGTLQNLHQPDPATCSAFTISRKRPWGTHTDLPHTLTGLPGGRTIGPEACSPLPFPATADQASAISGRPQLALPSSGGEGEQAPSQPGKWPTPHVRVAPPLLVPTGQGQDAVLKGRLMSAAQAVHRGDLEAFSNILGSLRKFARSNGSAMERCMHVHCQALLLRVRREAFAFMNTKPKKLPIQVHIDCKMWVFTRTPFIAGTVMCGVTALLPHLHGKRSAHIVVWGEALIGSLPPLMKLLGTPSTRRASTMPTREQPGGPRGTACGPHGAAATGSQNRVSAALNVEPGNGSSARRPPQEGGCLRELRVTVVDPIPLKLPLRHDLWADRNWDAVAESLQNAAQTLGISLEFQCLLLQEHNLEVLDVVQRREGEEVVAALCNMQLQTSNRHPDHPEGGVHKVMKMLKRIGTDVLAIVEEDCEASSPDFLDRFAARLDFDWALRHALDACQGPEAIFKKHLVTFERLHVNIETVGIIACEGDDRRVFPRKRNSWSAWLQNWGFRNLPLDPRRLRETVVRLAKQYPRGFSFTADGLYGALTWCGQPLAFSSSFVRSD